MVMNNEMMNNEIEDDIELYSESPREIVKTKMLSCNKKRLNAI